MDNSKENNISNSSHSIFDPKNVSFFNNDEFAIFLYKKTEKLIAALYMVSNLFPDSEPLKWDIREAGLCLLPACIQISNSGISDREIIINKYGASILEVLSLIEVSLYSGYISKMNHTIIQRELSNTLSLVERREKIVKEKNGFVLSDRFFESEEKFNLESIQNSQNIYSSKPPTLNQQFVSETPKIEDKGQDRQIIQSTHVPKINTVNKPFIRDNFNKKDSRQTIIINLLKKQSNLTIKDFTKVIPECSEKTIQRELLKLVSEGVLKKEGERRWSKYSLKE